jgi:hypothetical protein
LRRLDRLPQRLEQPRRFVGSRGAQIGLGRVLEVTALLEVTRHLEAPCELLAHAASAPSVARSASGSFE